MYLRLEDWSLEFFLSRLEEKGLKHGGHIIKVYASEVDPRTKDMYGRETVAVVEIDDSPFREDEIFNYEGRGTYTGVQLNQRLGELGLNEDAKKRMRALFRFANLPETGFTREAMQLRNTEGNWLIDHPFGDIDGVSRAVQLPEKYSATVHLDIFVPTSLEKLARLLGVDDIGEAEGLIGYKEHEDYRRRLREEQPRGKESW